MEFCWEVTGGRTKRGAKKISFVITPVSAEWDEKAGDEQIDEVIMGLEALTHKIDKISMNIVTEGEVEKEHLECKW